MSRIGIIRDVIEQFGGKHVKTYYADNNYNPLSRNSNHRGDAVYKVPRWEDGLLNDEVRRTVVDELNKHPEVKRAYMSRPMNRIYYGSSGPHIKVVFHGISESVKNRKKRSVNF